LHTGNAKYKNSGNSTQNMQTEEVTIIFFWVLLSILFCELAANRVLVELQEMNRTQASYRAWYKSDAILVAELALQMGLGLYIISLCTTGSVSIDATTMCHQDKTSWLTKFIQGLTHKAMKHYLQYTNNKVMQTIVAESMISISSQCNTINLNTVKSYCKFSSNAQSETKHTSQSINAIQPYHLLLFSMLI
jgi:hypothetical protein